MEIKITTIYETESKLTTETTRNDYSELLCFEPWLTVCSSFVNYIYVCKFKVELKDALFFGLQTQDWATQPTISGGVLHHSLPFSKTSVNPSLSEHNGHVSVAAFKNTAMVLLLAYFSLASHVPNVI